MELSFNNADVSELQIKVSGLGNNKTVGNFRQSRRGLGAGKADTVSSMQQDKLPGWWTPFRFLFLVLFRRLSDAQTHCQPALLCP